MVLGGLPKDPTGIEMRMNGLREGMILEQVGTQQLEELLEGAWCNHSAHKILEEVHRLCDPAESAPAALKDVTLIFRGRFEALSKPDKLDP